MGGKIYIKSGKNVNDRTTNLKKIDWRLGKMDKKIKKKLKMGDWQQIEK